LLPFSPLVEDQKFITIFAIVVFPLRPFPLVITFCAVPYDLDASIFSMSGRNKDLEAADGTEITRSIEGTLGRYNPQSPVSRIGGGSWQSDKDTPHHKQMIQQIIKLLN
jgi:hypothetical protein